MPTDNNYSEVMNLRGRDRDRHWRGTKRGRNDVNTPVNFSKNKIKKITLSELHLCNLILVRVSRLTSKLIVVQPANSACNVSSKADRQA